MKYMPGLKIFFYDIIFQRLVNINTCTPICDYWTIYNNSSVDGIRKVAWGINIEIKQVIDRLAYKKITAYE